MSHTVCLLVISPSPLLDEELVASIPEQMIPHIGCFRITSGLELLPLTLMPSATKGSPPGLISSRSSRYPESWVEKLSAAVTLGAVTSCTYFDYIFVTQYPLVGFTKKI